jgi:hypothetical protein
MERPSKKDIKASVDKLKEKASGNTASGEQKVGKPAAKKNSMRIRKQGI